MKTKFITTLLVLWALFSKAQNNVPEVYDNSMQTIFANLEKNRIPNGLLLDAALEYADLKKYDGTLPDSSYTSSRAIIDIYNTLVMSRLHTDAFIPKSPDEFTADWKGAQEQDIIPLAGLLYKYSEFSDITQSNAQNNGDPGNVTVSNDQIYDKYVNGVWQNPYQEKYVFAMSPSISSSNKFNFKIHLPNNLFISNQTAQIQQVEYKLSDNQQFQILPSNQLIDVSYSAEGTYTWVFKITLTNNQILYSHTKFNIDGHLDQYVDGTTNTNSLTSTLSQYQKHYIDPYVVSFNGSTPVLKGRATVYYRLAPGHSQITRPFIVAEGFDMGVIVAPTQEAGLTNIDNFRSNVDNIPILFSELYNNYDIIYVDWNNGVDYIQNNADLFKKAIQWVNSQKQGTEKNVVMGQSMGGLIARYALKDMEDNNINHDTKLFISHDSPHLGANLPVGLQQMLVHVSKAYVKSPLAGAAEFLVPLFMQGISVKDVLTLADTPAARQMLLNYVNKNYNIDNSVHNAWQTVIQSKGFPQQTRNVSISNGSECGTDQNLSDLLRLYKETNQQHLFSDVISTIIGGFIIRPDLIFLSSLPGSSKYVFDFTVRPMTNVNENKQLYSGSIKYKKKILWLINANVNLLNGSKNQPSNILPYDKYGGGRFDLNFTALPDFLAQNISINPFGFVPTPSALDYKLGYSSLQQSDFQKSFSFANDGINTPFSHFVTERMDQNNTHISFSQRNGQFIVNQLSSDPVVQSQPLSSANLCGNNLSIGGKDILCDNNVATYTVGFANSISWSITEGASLVDVIGASNSAQIKIQPKTGANGLVILQVLLTEDGTNATITKKVWIGTPLIQISQTHTNVNKRISLVLESTNPLATLADMGVFTYNVSWFRPNNNITKQGGFTYAFTETSLALDGVPVEATVSNICGIGHTTGSFFPDSTYCGGLNIANTGGNSYSVNIINPCPPSPPTPNPPYGINSKSNNSGDSSASANSDLQNLTVKVFNSMGMQILSTSNLQFDLTGQMIGTYYVKVLKNGKLVHTQTLLKN